MKTNMNTLGLNGRNNGINSTVKNSFSFKLPSLEDLKAPEKKAKTATKTNEEPTTVKPLVTKRTPKNTVTGTYQVPSTLLELWRVIEVNQAAIDYNTIRGYYKNIGYFLQYTSNEISGEWIEDFRVARLTGIPEILDLGLKQVKKPTANRDAAGQYRFLEFCHANQNLFELKDGVYRVKDPISLELLLERLNEGATFTKKTPKQSVKTNRPQSASKTEKTTVKAAKPEMPTKTVAKNNIRDEHLKSVLKQNNIEGLKFTL